MNLRHSGRCTIARLLALGCVAALIAGCGDKPAGGPPGMPAGGMPPAQVSVISVEPRDVPVRYEYVAQTTGYREVEVRARVTGILQKRNFREGAAVRRGQPLFVIDPAPFEVALAKAQADLDAVQARLAQAQREVARLTPVLEAKAISQKELDDSASAEQVARADVKSALARVSEARLNLSYTQVESPITGITSRAVVSEGALVSGPNVLLTTVTQTDPMYVIFGVPDREFLALRRDADLGRLKLPADRQFQARIRLSDGTLYDGIGAVNFSDVRVNTQTGTSESRAEFSNKANLLRAGEFVRVLLEGAVRPNAIVVPQRAVLEIPKGKFVYVVNAQSRAEARPVEVGEWANEGWVINDGLKPGERVIVDGVMKIGPGAAVQVAAADGAPAKPTEKGEGKIVAPADKK
ncbi:MAG: efflux RND transporter periplasmic adaptor subunit [Betaproteobacteria bacterium]|nr:efflux RND transporter periplasmic adaptor subunit [Betaproteobacteria bacterium]